jgi:hypothetical protein
VKYYCLDNSAVVGTSVAAVEAETADMAADVAGKRTVPAGNSAAWQDAAGDAVVVGTEPADALEKIGCTWWKVAGVTVLLNVNPGDAGAVDTFEKLNIHITKNM